MEISAEYWTGYVTMCMCDCVWLCVGLYVHLYVHTRVSIMAPVFIIYLHLCDWSQSMHLLDLITTNVASI